MRITTFLSRRRTGWAVAALLAAATVGAATLPAGLAGAAVDAQANGATDGLMCEKNAGSNSFVLSATDGYATTPDGNSLYMWGYTIDGRPFQLPGPTLCVDSGAKVTVTLKNARIPENVSIMWPGQNDVRVDGQPVGPEFATPGDPTTALLSLTNSAAAAKVTTTAVTPGGSVTYTFTAGSPGTYLYSSGTDVAKQREMGLYGALVVRPVDGSGAEIANQANGDAATAYDGEFLYMLSQVDPDFHTAVEKNRAFNSENIVGRYFFINGRSMPDTLAPNNASWMPSQPYGALIHITANAKKPALIRYVNAGPVNYPFHPHGSSQRVVTRDGVPTHNAGGQDASQMKFLIDVGPGQSVDTLERFDNVYDPAAAVTGQNATGTCSTDPMVVSQCASLPSDIQLPQLQDQIVGPGTETWFSENPYLGAPGGAGPIPNGMIQNNQCGEFYHVAHSHALYQATNYGASFGGMMTLIRIDPPGGCK